MFMQPYQPMELQFAWCYRVYYRWRTHRAHRQSVLPALTTETLNSLLHPYNIHFLEASATETDVMVLTSLLPGETVAACIGKTKGRVSKWFREQVELPPADKLFSRGYFACTTGQSTAEAVTKYLDAQSEHHGYASRPHPPVYVHRFPFAPADEQRLTTDHAITALRFHLVLSTWSRKGVFTREAAEATATKWQRAQEEHAMAIDKMSFLPDHVHVAVHVHPSQSPASVAMALMNESQELIWGSFDNLVVGAGVPRLWQPSAYIGSYGDLNSLQIGAYVRQWERLAGS